MRRIALVLFAACAWLASAAAQADGKTRIVVVGDVHGAYAPLAAILVTAGVASAEGHWVGGEAHLVQLGDVLDRGPDERRSLDLLMTLDKQAKAAGGDVVMILGNHEIMNMFGDWRYATKEAVADFGGADARRAALAPDGKYGRWLRKQPAVAEIDGNVFVHGGISREVAKLGVRGIRDRVRDELARVDSARARAVRLRRVPAEADLDALLRQKPPELASYGSWLIGHGQGPFWFRGYETWANAQLARELPTILSRLGAKRIFVGHSVQLPASVRVRARGGLLLVDGGMLGPPTYPGGETQAVEIIGDTLTLIDARGVRTPVPVEPK
jgi:hypothetical protein